jgi:ribokinase
MGEHGALISGKDGEGFVQSFPVKPVDTTAAGDVFNGALAVALAEGLALKEAARFASAAAAISVTRMGAQTSAPSRFEITEFLAKRDGAMSAGKESVAS